MTDISDQEAAEVVLAIALQARVPVVLYSEPGAGKSATVRATAEAMKSTLYTIMLSVREPTDQGGLPAVFENDGEKVVQLVPPGWARDVIKNDGGTVFFDEMSNATPTVQNSALRIVQEGVVGDSIALPKSTSYVMALNPPRTNAGANHLTAGIANRSLHLMWPFDYRRWRDGMINGWKAPKIPVLPANWRQKHRTTALDLVIGFLDTQPQLAQQQPADLEAQGRAWPSGRTWDMATDMLAAALSLGFKPTSTVVLLIVGGLVGAGPATAMQSWISTRNLPSVAELIAFPKTAQMPKRSDQLITMLGGVVSHVASAGTEEPFQAAWTILLRVAEIDVSLAVPAARKLVAMAKPGWAAGPKHPYGMGLAKMAKHMQGSKADYGRRA